MRGKKRSVLTVLAVAILTMAMSVSVFAAVRITFSGTQTMATNCSRRIYVTGAGSRKVSISTSSGAVTVKKDSKSYIVTGKKSGSSYVTVKVGSIKKRIHTVVLSDQQIADRIIKRVRGKYKSAGLVEKERRGNSLKLLICKPQGDGAPGMYGTVNLSTGRAVCSDGWEEFFSKVPKSFLVW